MQVRRHLMRLLQFSQSVRHKPIIQSLRETVNAPECKNELSLLLHTFKQNTISKVPRLSGPILRATITIGILATPRF